MKMENNRMISSMIVVMMCMTSLYLIPTASAVAGRASFYSVGSVTSCFGSQNQGTMVTAANPTLYSNGAGCGRRYRITCTGQSCRSGSVTVKIVDICPQCSSVQFELSQQAFSAIADPNAGIVSIDYVRV